MSLPLDIIGNNKSPSDSSHGKRDRILEPKPLACSDIVDLQVVPVAPPSLEPGVKEQWPAASKLCSVCQKMLGAVQRHHNLLDYAYHNTIEGLRKGVEQTGCALCYQFWKDAGVDMEQSLDKYRDCSPGSLISFRQSRGPGLVSTYQLYWQVPKVDVSGTEQLAVYLYPKESIGLLPTNSGRSLNLAAWWLQNCRNSHPECQSRRATEQLPTRLLNLTEHRLRICSGADLPASSRYASLSHCWGSKRYLSLTNNNLASLYVDIPMTKLSQTVIDAIKIARCLGLEFLWVDTLCIIQDDSEDWSHESSLMSAVYGGSDLNIAASSAKDGSEGCFFDIPEVSRCDVEIEVDAVPYRYEVVPSGYVNMHIDQAPLQRRGWVLQERMLSRRVLHFTRSELFWECYHGQASETFPQEEPTSVLAGSLQKKPLRLSMWPSIVAAYSCCQLTYATDKFVAISGLARHIQGQHQLRDEYYAGMWRTHLEFQLCWYVSDHEVGSETSYDTYIAPTWSWASQPRPVATEVWDLSADRFELWATAICVDINHVTENIFGAVSDAKLYMSCKLLARISSLPEESEVINDDTKRDATNDGDVKDKSGVTDENGHHLMEFSLFHLDHSITQYAVSFMLDTTNNSTSDASSNSRFALPIIEQDDMVFGIVLEPSHTGQGIYTRVGFFSFDIPDMPLAYADRAVPWVHERDCSEVRMGEDRKPVYMIEII
ncbi:heterokaryon incompatibility protein-domain-containing protein [Phaeosphaeria sp. MPI-PUGE-AT-0046c]|nr:heterokaryon incompatibility protein-domain-containing protein [Phaeosphaeria sp. MPI-PUGE-AT-0046c]